MIRISKIDSTALIKGKLIIKVLRLGTKDIQTVKNSVPFGFDSNPNIEYRAIYANTGENGENVLLGIINNDAKAAPGESRIFSNDSDGNEITQINLKADGNIEIAGNNDNMVRYSKLQEAYDQLKADFDGFVSAFNGHLHATAAVGPPSPPTPVPSVIPVLPSTGDITGSKIDDVLTNGG